jgi:hypothetical protein
MPPLKNGGHYSDALPSEKLNEFDSLYRTEKSNPEFWNLDNEKVSRLSSGMPKEITENLIKDKNNWVFASVRSVDFLLKIKKLIKLVEEKKYLEFSIGLCDFFIMYHNFGYTEYSNELKEKRVKAKPVIAKEKNVEKRKENRHKLYKEFKEKGYPSMKIYREIVKTESPELKTRDKTFKPKVNAMKTWFSDNPFSNG